MASIVSSASHSASAAACAGPSVGERRIGRTLDRPLVDAHRERVADEQQLHGSSVLACAAVADLFVAEQPGPPGAPRVVLVHGSLDRSTAFLRVARALPDLTVVRYDRRGLRQVARGRARRRRSTSRWTTWRRWSATSPPSSSATASAAWWRSPSPAAIPSWPARWSPTRRRCRGCRRGRRTPRVGVALAEAGDDGDAAEQFMRRIVGDERWEALPDAHQGAAASRGSGAGRRAPLAAPAEPRALRPRRHPGAGGRRPRWRVASAPPGGGSAAGRRARRTASWW